MAEPPPPQDIILPESPKDSVSSLHFAPGSSPQAPSQDFLCATSWDTTVCAWEINSTTGECIPRAKIEQPEPVLCSAWSADRQRIAFGGCENVVKLWQLQPSQVVNIGQHAAPIRQILDLSAMTAQIQSLPTLVSGGWDKKLKYWDIRSQTGQPVHDVDLPEKVYCMDSKGYVLVVATAERHIVVYDLRKPTVPYRTMNSPLKFQSRCITLFPASDGFALGSIEGRVSIHHINDPVEGQPDKNFAFKCHRQNNDVISAVNGIVFHPRHGTFATYGGDGAYTYWDHLSKQRLKAFAPQKNAILCGDFNPSGTLFAYAVGYDWSHGVEQAEEKKEPCHIALHKVIDSEIARRAPQQ